MAHILTYCGEQVRAHDRDRFLLSLFAPKDSQEALWALFAFNIEIAKTCEVVSDAMLGRIRLQWWHDAIVAVYEGGPVLEHEVVKPLAEAIRTYDLPREAFETLIAARIFDLEGRAPESMDEFMAYVDGTSTPLFALAVQIAGGDAELEPVSVVAMNYAMAGLMRAAAFHQAQGRMLLPPEPKDIPAHFVWKVKAQSRFLRASQRLACLYMKQLKSAGYDVFSPVLQRPIAFKELKLLTC